MFRSDITIPTPIVLIAVVAGLMGGLGYGWVSTEGAAHGVHIDASDALGIGVSEATAADLPDAVAVTDVKETASTPPTKRVAKVPARRVLDESTIGPGTASILRRKRGEYAGRLVPIDSTSACPRVAKAFFRMRADAQRNGVRLYVTSGFRTRGHQTRLYRELGPVYAARPGKSLHRRATELDIRMRPGGGDRTHRWLTKHGARFGFVQRYSWEPWHWGYAAGCRA